MIQKGERRSKGSDAAPQDTMRRALTVGAIAGLLRSGLSAPSRVATAWILSIGPATSALAQRAEDFFIHVRNNRANQVFRLLLRGADPNQTDAEGNPALMVAIRESAWEVYDLLLGDPRLDHNLANPFGETALMYLALLGEEDRVRNFLRRPDLDLGGDGRWTPLHYAARQGHLGTMDLLLEAGALINAWEPSGQTPLMMAATGGHIEAVRKLLLAGAESRAYDRQGRTAADLAQQNGQRRLASALQERIDRDRRVLGEWQPPVVP